jgi:hypothetical protein
MLRTTLGFVLGAAALAQPAALHPANPHYFQYRGKPTVLVSNSEHYGAVLNAKFQYARYLDALAADGLNYTRIFAGTYVEEPGAFGIARNNLAPAPAEFIAPWPRSGPGLAPDGLPKYDLARIDESYLARLNDFLREAARRGIVVEVTLFSSHYGEPQWKRSPLHPLNNINGTTLADFRRLHTLDNGGALPHQETFVRRLARELNSHDNLIWEIQNEPWADRHTMGPRLHQYAIAPALQRWPHRVEIPAQDSLEWQARVAQWIAEEERKLGRRHLVALNYANFQLAVPAVPPNIDILNFHYAYPGAVRLNYGWNMPIAYDESGFLGPDDAEYLREAWRFMLAGGAVFNGLDYSFTVGFEDGTDTAANGPGGGSPAFRRQLGFLRRFLMELPLAGMKPDTTTLRHAPGLEVQMLSAPGRVWAAYVEGPERTRLEMDLARGRYEAEWFHPATGESAGREVLQHAGGVRSIHLRPNSGALAFRLRKQ